MTRHPTRPLLLALACLSLAGCNGSRISQKGGEASLTSNVLKQEPVVANQKGTIRHKDGSVEEYTRIEQGGARVETKEAASATGVSGEASGDKTTIQGESTPPKLTLPSGGSVEGTGGTFGATAMVIPGAGRNPLLWVGILFIVGAGVCVYLQLRRAAMIAAVLGAAFIVAAMLPAWAWFIIAGAALLGGGFYVWAEKQQRAKNEALRATLAAANDLPPVAKTEFENSLLNHAEAKTGDMATIKEVRVADDLPHPGLTSTPTP